MDAKPTYVSMITPLGEGGIGVIAVWGPGAVDLLEEFFTGTKVRTAELSPGRIAHGTFRRDEEVIDEVILARPDSPPFQVEEPYFEVNCHGGVAAVRAVLGCLRDAGARLVEGRRPTYGPSDPPLAGNALRARALEALPGAPTRLASLMLLHQAERALAGELDRLARPLRTGEGSEAERRLKHLLRTAPLGRALLSPPRVALVGPPNAGKSTLFNALLEEERVIVHHEPGTTRDIVRETVSVRGVPFELMDAAGIGAPRDELEREAERRARSLMEECDVALAVFDATEGVALESLPPARPETRVIPVANKMDLLDEARKEVPGDDLPEGTVWISARSRQNLNAVEEALLKPYRETLERCRDGGPVVFDRAGEAALREVAAALQEDSAEAALRELRRLRGES